MEFDSAGPDLQRTARDVFDRIPEDAQRRIESACDRITFTVDGDSEAEFLPADREIRVVVSRINDFSEKGKRGILAHEFGHAYAYSPGQVQPGETNERLANMCAQSWGFLSEIDAMKAGTVRLRERQYRRHDGKVECRGNRSWATIRIPWCP